MYNMTVLQEAETISKLVLVANDFTGGIFLTLFLFAQFFIMLMVLKRWDFNEALLTSSFISFVLAALMVYGEMIPLIYALVFLIIAAFTGFYTFIIKK